MKDSYPEPMTLSGGKLRLVWTWRLGQLVASNGQGRVIYSRESPNGYYAVLTVGGLLSGKTHKLRVFGSARAAAVAAEKRMGLT